MICEKLYFPEDAPRIVPSLIPDCEYDLMCVSLEAALRLAFRDPKNRADYESWKTQRRGEAMA